MRDLNLAKKIEKPGLTSRPILYILSNIWELSPKKVEKLFTLGASLDDQERMVEINSCIEYILRYDAKFAL